MTSETSGLFAGTPGGSYAFYSVARDLTGNMEDVPASADASSAIIHAGPPAIVVPPAVTVMTGADGASCGAFVSDAVLGRATATDGCSTVGIDRSGVPAGNLFPIGTTVITCTATDQGGNTATATQQVTVIDNTPPQITGASVDKPELWPPNHQMVEVTLGYNVMDNCGAQSGTTSTVSVTSNEPVNDAGDGNTAPDWEVIDANRVLLRAERSGKGGGRIYTLTITATDGAGNSSSHAVTVRVPKSRRD